MKRFHRTWLTRTRGTSRNRIASRSGALAFLYAIGLFSTLAIATALPVQSFQVKEKKVSALHWDPPRADTPIPALSATPPCSLPDVLKLGGKRAQELFAHLQEFDAQEQIRYEQTDDIGMPEVFADAKFDYLVNFGGSSGALKVHETRTSAIRGDSCQYKATSLVVLDKSRDRTAGTARITELEY